MSCTIGGLREKDGNILSAVDTPTFNYGRPPLNRAISTKKPRKLDLFSFGLIDEWTLLEKGNSSVTVMDILLFLIN